MNMERSIEVLEILLEAEIDAGRPPGFAPVGIYDGPKQIRSLINHLKSYLGGGEKGTLSSLIGSVYGSYLGRGELFWQQGLDKILPTGFDRELAAAIDYLTEQKM